MGPCVFGGGQQWGHGDGGGRNGLGPSIAATQVAGHAACG